MNQLNTLTGASPQPGQVPDGAPSRTVSSRVTATTQGTPGNGMERPVTFWSVLDAFRRRWVPAVAVAIPAALLVSGLLWQVVPAQFETTALMKISQFQKSLVDTDEQRSEFIYYRDSQINYIQSRTNLESAMRVDGVKESRLMRDKAHAVDFLEQNLDVKSDFSEEFIKISLAGEYPEDIAMVVNAVKDVYLDDVVYEERNERLERLKTLEVTFKDLDRNVRKNQDRIDRLAKELGTGDPKIAVTKQGMIQQNLRELSTELRKLNDEIREEEALRNYLIDRGLSPDSIQDRLPQLGLGSNEPPPTPSLSGRSSREDDLKKELYQIRRQITRFQQNLRNWKNHPDVRKLTKRAEQVTDSLKSIAKNRAVPGGGKTSLGISKYDWLLKQRQQLDADIKAADENFELMGERLVELSRETKDIEYLVNSRDDLQQKIQNLKIDLDSPVRVKVIQYANVPEKRNVKKRAQMAAVGGLGALTLVLGGFTMFEWFSHRVGNTSDIANAVNLRLVGTIPSPDKGGLLGLGVFAGKVDYDEWNRAVIESMDVVRTYLMRHIDPSRSASILITSASANEGKTTVSCQLAASLARSGKRVAIVDCDFRRPSAHLMMDGREGPGICEYLRGEVSLPDICQETQAAGLTFIPAGKVDQNVLQVLTTDGGRSIIETLKSQFDFVVIDTSPMLFVAEPSMLAQNADIVLLSTRKDYSRIPYVAQSRDSLRSLQVPLLGCVMVGSDSDFQRSSYGYRQEIQKSARREQMAQS